MTMNNEKTAMQQSNNNNNTSDRADQNSNLQAIEIPLNVVHV